MSLSCHCSLTSQFLRGVQSWAFSPTLRLAYSLWFSSASPLWAPLGCWFEMVSPEMGISALNMWGCYLMGFVGLVTLTLELSPTRLSVLCADWVAINLTPLPLLYGSVLHLSQPSYLSGLGLVNGKASTSSSSVSCGAWPGMLVCLKDIFSTSLLTLTCREILTPYTWSGEIVSLLTENRNKGRMIQINMHMNIHKSTQWNVMFCFAQSIHKLFSCFPFSAIRIPINTTPGSLI